MVVRHPAYLTRLVLALFAGAGAGSRTAFAHDTIVTTRSQPQVCANELVFPPLTLGTAREGAVERNRKVRAAVEEPNFFDLPGQARVEQTDEWRAPLAFREMFGRGVGFVAAPTPTSNDALSVGLIEEQNSFITHVSTNWAGRSRSTAAYVSLPGAKIRSAGDYLIGPEHKVVLFHLHGGGTPTATGKNGVSIGEKVAARGFPTVGIDMPGHGIGTKNIDGLETTEQLVDYVLKVMAQLIHPSVKVVLSGHSWGGQFAAYMHRHSDEEKYHQIEEFISLSPPVDVSNAGDARVKHEFEADWHRRMVAGEFDDQIAETDLDFLKNILKHSKESEIGRVFLAATDTQYATPPLTPERLAQLKPLTLAIGSDDMLFKGREQAYRRAWGSLNQTGGRSRYIEIGPGMTFKGVRKTGHNIFDVYDKDPVTGEDRHQIYAMIGDTLAKIARQPAPIDPKGLPSLLAGIYANFPNITEMPISSHAPVGIRKRLSILRAYVAHYDEIKTLDKPDRKKAEASVSQAYNELMALERSATYYANSIGFRAALNDEVQNVEVSSADIAELSGRKVAFDKYERDINRLREESARATAQAEKTVVQALAKRLGLHQHLDYDRAVEEVGYPALTPERREQLERFVELSRGIEAELKAAKDAKFESTIENLSATFAPTLNALGLTIQTYNEGLSGFGAQKNLNKTQNQQRVELANLAQDVAAAVKARDARQHHALSERLAPAMQDLRLIDPRSARRQLDAERSPERTVALRQFIAEYEVVRSAAREEGAVKLAAKIAEVPRPSGLGVEDSIAELKIEHDRLMNLAHAPAGLGLDDLVARMVAKRRERDLALKGRDGEVSIDQLAKQVDQLRLDRAKAVGIWTANWDQGLFTSHQVAEDAARLNALEIDYKTKYFEYTTAAAERELELLLANRWSVDELQHMPPPLRAKFLEYMKARRDVIKERGIIEGTRVADAQNGYLEPRADLGPESARAATRLVLETVDLARKIWGPSRLLNPQGTDDSLSSRLARDEKILEERRRKLTASTRELEEMRARYVSLMREKGQSVPVDILRVRVKDYLNSEVGIDDLLTKMDRDPRLYQAFEQMNRVWDDLSKQLRSIHNRAPDAGY